MTDSRIPGFYKLNLRARRQQIAERSGQSLGSIETLFDTGGLSAEDADKVVENVLGVYALPFGVALNFRINGIDHLVPMVVEEPSVIAAASNAARMVREGGGFWAKCPEALMTGQVQLYDVPDLAAALTRLEAERDALLQLATAAVPGLVQRGGGPRELLLRPLDATTVVVDVLVDCRNAMGANLVNTVAEALGPRCAELAGAKLGLRILTNLCDHRRVNVSCSVPVVELVANRGRHAADVELLQEARSTARAIAQASRFAAIDPYRAATHNKGIMNGIDSVVVATGNDYRAVEAGAHAFAARTGRYQPLATWHLDGDFLVGELELPLALGTVGGTLRVHPGARQALAMANVKNAAELAMVAAAAGLASNLAALRALATEGIQRGHMSLHARSVAVAAGAEGDEVELVASRIAERGTIQVDVARAVLADLREGRRHG